MFLQMMDTTNGMTYDQPLVIILGWISDKMIFFYKSVSKVIQKIIFGDSWKKITYLESG